MNRVTVIVETDEYRSTFTRHDELSSVADLLAQVLARVGEVFDNRPAAADPANQDVGSVVPDGRFYGTPADPLRTAQAGDA